MTDDDLHQVTGLVATVDQRLWLCTSLAESDPPQRGVPGIALAGGPTSNPDALFGDNLVTRNNVRWTNEPVTVVGAITNTGSTAELWLTD